MKVIAKKILPDNKLQWKPIVSVVSKILQMKGVRKVQQNRLVLLVQIALLPIFRLLNWSRFSWSE